MRPQNAGFKQKRPKNGLLSAGVLRRRPSRCRTEGVKSAKHYKNRAPEAPKKVNRLGRRPLSEKVWVGLGLQWACETQTLTTPWSGRPLCRTLNFRGLRPGATAQLQVSRILGAQRFLERAYLRWLRCGLQSSMFLISKNDQDPCGK